jgi:hypothetical protein
LPGGSCGPSTKITSRVATTLVTIVRIAMRRMWLGALVRVPQVTFRKPSM